MPAPSLLRPPHARVARSRERAPVVVLGAGLTGMSTAYHLQQAGIEHRLLERSSRVGGLVVTDEEGGFRFDRTGHLLHGEESPNGALALEWIGPDHRVLARESAVWLQGGYTPYPFQANLRGLPPRVAYECLLGFVEAWAARAPSSTPRQAPRDFREFCEQNFGRGISDHFMVPYNTRLWGVPPEQITAQWCERFVPVPKLEDVVAGMVGLEGRALGYNARFVYPRRGIGQLTDALASRLDGIELGRNVREIDTRARTLWVDDETVHYDTLVSTAPLPALVALLRDPPEPVRRAASRLRCTHLWYLDLAVEHPCPLPYHWVYVPEATFPFYRVGCYSNFSSEMAPAGKSGLYVELAAREPPVLDTLLPTIVAELQTMGFLLGPDAVAFARLRRIDHAYVVFDHGFDDALGTVQRYLRAHRVLSVGRYGGFDYSSMTDAIGYGRDAAAEAQSLLVRGPSGESP